MMFSRYAGNSAIYFIYVFLWDENKLLMIGADNIPRILSCGFSFINMNNFD